MGKQSLRAFVVLMLVLGSLLAIGGIAMAQDESLSIYDNLVKAGNFTTLTSAIDEKGLTETYTGDGNEYTFFAPNDAAFQALSLSDRIKLYRNPQTLIDTLNHMTVEGVYNTADLTDGTVLTALDGGTLTITHEGSKILVNGAEITSPDLAASNGVIHVVNSVIPLEGAAPVVEEEVAAEDEEVAATETTTATVEASAVVTATEASTETVAGAAIEAVTERVTAEATEAPAEEATAVPAEEATAEPAEEATAVPAEEATAEPAEEATAAPAEEATAEPAEEATAVPAEEAAAESAEEATAEPAEEATAEPAEEAAATPEPTEDAPEELPATGAESNSLALVAVAVLTIMLLGAFTFVSRRNA